MFATIVYPGWGSPRAGLPLREPERCIQVERSVRCCRNGCASMRGAALRASWTVIEPEPAGVLEPTNIVSRPLRHLIRDRLASRGPTRVGSLQVPRFPLEQKACGSTALRPVVGVVSSRVAHSVDSSPRWTFQESILIFALYECIPARGAPHVP